VFGRGIVPTADNFGVYGERPSHPELLDVLAAQFVGDGWTHQETDSLSADVADLSAVQPGFVGGLSERSQNRLLSHYPSGASSESIRDAILLSGRLDRTMYGRASNLIGKSQDYQASPGAAEAMAPQHLYQSDAA
jgi:hypothetical protein